MTALEQTVTAMQAVRDLLAVRVELLERTTSRYRLAVRDLDFNLNRMKGVLPMEPNDEVMQTQDEAAAVAGTTEVAEAAAEGTANEAATDEVAEAQPAKEGILEEIREGLQAVEEKIEEVVEGALEPATADTVIHADEPVGEAAAEEPAETISEVKIDEPVAEEAQVVEPVAEAATADAPVTAEPVEA